MDWYPHYIIDFRSDTHGLSPTAEGIYRRLLDEYYLTERPLPDNDAVLAFIARVSLPEWLAVADTIRPMFKANGHAVLNQKRCDQVLVAQTKRRKDGARRARQLRKNGVHGA